MIATATRQPQPEPEAPALSLDAYLKANAKHLAAQTEALVRPLHVPGVDPLPDFSGLKRQPFEAQKHVIAASMKTLDRQRSLTIVGEMGCGKAQPLSAKILTPTGWTTMGEIQVGDDVIDPDGGHGEVTGVFPQGERYIYRVTFGDGSSTECCSSHLWHVQTQNDRFFDRPARVMSLEEISEHGVVANRSAGRSTSNKKWFIPVTKPVSYAPQESPLPIDPYVLGVLLGDGCLAGTEVSFTSADQEIVTEVGVRVGHDLKLNEIPHPSCPSYRIIKSSGRNKRGDGTRNNSVTDSLRSLGLAGSHSWDKFIPEVYKLASFEERVLLLQGLMDTDGTVGDPLGWSGGRFGRGTAVEITTASPQLARDVQELVWSLGGIATSSIKKNCTYTYKGEKKQGRPAYRVRVSIETCCPFRMERKTSRYRGRVKYHPTRGMASIELVGKKQCQCIAVNTKRNLYVTDDFIVTHNTQIATNVVALHADSKPYRSLVMAPGHLVSKWESEIKDVIPNVKVHVIRNWKDAVSLIDAEPPTGPEWYLLSRDRAKLGSKWKPAVFGRGHLAHKLQALCPACGQVPTNAKGQELDLSKLDVNRCRCEAIDPHTGKRCNSPLWTATNELRRWAPAEIIKSKLPRHFFRYFIGDEAHECASESAQGVSFGQLASCAKYAIAMTGTLTNGKAESLRPLLFRLCSGDVKAHGFDWDKPMPFVERYGRIETTIREKESFGADNRMSAGKATKTRRCVPGIMPTLYGQMLIGNTVFLSLEQVADELPDLDEHVVSVPMDPELRANYDTVSEVLRQHVTAMLQRGDRRLLGAMLTTFLAYPDLPFDWDTVGYWDTPKQILLNGKRPERRFVPVIKPPDLPSNKLYAKERKLLEIVKAEKAAGRQCWVYVQYTDKHDVAARLEKVLTDAGFRASILRQKVKPEDRLDWIAEHAPNLDVCICHPKLVQTGVDLFDKGGSYNFPTLIFYEVGYIATDLRQASRRSWRIGQAKGCKVYYLYYGNSMAEKALALMGKKVLAAEAIEGKFSSEGLVALDDGGSMELELARSLAANIDEPATAIWKSGRVHSRAEPAKIEEPLVSLPIKRAKPKPPKQTEIDWSVFDIDTPSHGGIHAQGDGKLQPQGSGRQRTVKLQRAVSEDEEPKSTVDWDAVAAAFAERPQLKIVG